MKMRDLQNLLDFWRKSDDPHRPTFFDHRHVIAHQFANPGTVQIIESGQIQYDVFMPLIQDAAHCVAKGRGLKGSEPPTNFEEGNIFRMPDGHREIQETLTPKNLVLMLP